MRGLNLATPNFEQETRSTPLIDFLRHDFAQLRIYLGDVEFGRLARAHVAPSFSRPHNARWHSNAFPAFMAQSVPWGSRPELAKEKRTFEFLTNNLEFSPLTIAQIYQRRWQIETLFKRIKQNYPLRNFLGDNENAIRIQVWCALIADLLLKIVSKQIKRAWSFSNLASMIRLHLMTYINLRRFLNGPEKALKEFYTFSLYSDTQKSLFVT